MKRELPGQLTISTTGYYGQSNFGDDLFLYACDFGAKEYWPQHHLRIVAPPLADPFTHGVSVVNQTRALAFQGESLTNRAFRGMVKLRSWFDSDLVIQAGGSVYQDVQLMSAKGMGRLLVRLPWGRFAAIGVSVGPFPSRQAAMRVERLLRHSDFIAVRDPASLQRMEVMSLPMAPTLAADLVGVLPEPLLVGRNARPRQEVLGLALIDRRGSRASGDLDNLVSGALEVAKRHHLTIRLIVLNEHPRHGDRNLALSVASKLEGSGVPVEISPVTATTWERSSAIAECAAVLSMRLHGAIVAYLTRTPFCLFEYHQKCTDFLDDISYPRTHRIPEGERKVAATLLDVIGGVVKNDLMPVGAYRSRALLAFSEAPWARGRHQLGSRG